MTYRVWLTKAAEADFVTAMETECREEKGVVRFQGLKVLTDNLTGKPYISVNLDPIDPTVELPTFPKGSIRKVTFTGKHFDGFRNDGVYRHKGATVYLKIVHNLKTPSVHNTEDVTHLEIYQEVQISAGSVRTLREIYTKVRAGEIEPSEDWGSPMKAPSFEQMLGLVALATSRAHGATPSPSDMN